MKKIAITLSMATILMGGLIGCGNNQEQGVGGLGGGDQRGFGYHRTDQRTDDMTEDRAGEGPITDMFTRDDRPQTRGLGRNGRHPATGLAGERGLTGQNGNLTRQNGTRGMNGAGYSGQGAGYNSASRNPEGINGTTRGANYRTRNRTDGEAGIVGDRPGYVDDRGILRRRNSTAERELGGLGQTSRRNMGQDDNEREFAYPNNYDSQTVNRINNRIADVDDVRDSRVIIHGNRIIIGVDTNKQDAQRIERNIRKNVSNMGEDREVIVVTERDQFNQVRTLDDRLRGGEAIEEIGATIEDMFQDFGRAIQRPFERSR